MKSLAIRLFAAFCVALSALAVGSGGAALAEVPGRAAPKIARAASLDSGHGAVIISVRSELYLLARLDLWFLREGGSIADTADLVRVSRSESGLSFGGNSTTRYKPLAVQLPAGRYRLVGHGAKCPKVPAPDERCLVDVKIAGIGDTVSFPSRGYGEDAPVFEVRAGAVTLAGDFALTARNRIEWSTIPEQQIATLARRFARLPSGPEPQVDETFRLKYPLRPRSMNDDLGRRY
jgi:hypothetical protein